MLSPTSSPGVSLVRGLRAVDAGLVTIGSILGTGVFLTTTDIARAVPHPSLILGVWALGGVLTMAGALTFAELGAMFPRAGGPYHFLREAYGPLPAFLFGWTSFLVIMSGGIATLAVGFGEYLGAFVPFFSTRHVLFSLPVGSWLWSVNGGQLGGAIAIVVLTLANCLGVREGAGIQNVLTAVKIASLVGLAGFGLAVAAPVSPAYFGPLPTERLVPSLGVAMIGVLWAYDGWYGATYLAGEMKRPERDLPIGLIGGTLVVAVLYVLVNLVYVRAVPVVEIARTDRIGEAAAAVLFGPAGARLIALAVLVSTFGCISSTILYSARGYLPMAQDGVFFRALAVIHPRYRTPAACILAQGLWATILTFSGTYEQLYTYVVFSMFLFHAAIGAAVFVLRRQRPTAERPFHVPGYPIVPFVFIATALAFVVNTVLERPTESALGLGLVALGFPAYAAWRRAAARAVPVVSTEGPGRA